MMRYYGYGFGSMMGGEWGVFGGLFCLVVFIDAVLLGLWLWKQINK